jgi:hypothetical protein
VYKYKASFLWCSVLAIWSVAHRLKGLRNT